MGPNPTDRAKNGVKKSLLVEADGGPLAIVVAGANVPDAKLLARTIEAIVLERPEPEPEYPQHLPLQGRVVPVLWGWGRLLCHQGSSRTISTCVVRRGWWTGTGVSVAAVPSWHQSGAAPWRRASTRPPVLMRDQQRARERTRCAPTPPCWLPYVRGVGAPAARSRIHYL